MKGGSASAADLTVSSNYDLGIQSIEKKQKRKKELLLNEKKKKKKVLNVGREKIQGLVVNANQFCFPV